jgi:hypothetical protein
MREKSNLAVDEDAWSAFGAGHGIRERRIYLCP